MTAWTDIVNIAAAVACLSACVFCGLIYKLTRANWTWVMFASFVYLFAIRAGIALGLDNVLFISRQLTLLNLALQAIALGMLFWSLRSMYKQAHGRYMDGLEEEREQMLRELAAGQRDIAADERDTMADRREEQIRYEEDNL
jgi:hypothetical protein